MLEEEYNKDPKAANIERGKLLVGLQMCYLYRGCFIVL